jgi:hypothetical protein
VWLVAETWSQLNTYLSLATFLALFGRRLGLGLDCHRWILNTWWNILFSLLLQLVVSERVAPSLSFFGFYVSELFGTKEIDDCSEIQNSPYLSCRTRSKFILTGG